MTRASLILSLCVLAGCAVRDVVLPPTPLTPLQYAAGLGVQLEDATEDPQADARETSLLETLSDVLAAPLHALQTGLTAQLAVLWSLGDALTGTPPNLTQRLAQVQALVGPHYASASR